MKKKTNEKIVPNLLKGLTGILFAVSTFILPGLLYAEEPGHVMPQEQVFLDPSQVEAAKKQLEDDAAGKSGPRTKNVEVVSGDRVIADVKVVEQDNKTKAPATDTVSETKKAEESNKATALPAKVETEKPVPAVKQEGKDTKTETVQPQKPVQEKTEISKTAETKVTQPDTKPGVTAAENKNETATSQAQPVLQHKPVRLSRFGVAKEFTTHNTTVGAVLQEMAHVLARKSFLSKEEVEVPFGTKVIEDPELEFGTKKVEKEGVKGKDLVIYENITRPGREQKIELDRRRIAEPVNEIVRKGVAQSVLTPNGYVKYKKVIYGEATAYTWGGGASGTTSIGLWPKRGIVAVDPRQIPYYTKLYIPGYGMAIAGDTGGAIVGNRIDLFMDSLYECYQWGRRDVEIYILE